MVELLRVRWPCCTVFASRISCTVRPNQASVHCVRRRCDLYPPKLASYQLHASLHGSMAVEVLPPRVSHQSPIIVNWSVCIGLRPGCYPECLCDRETNILALSAVLPSSLVISHTGRERQCY